MNLLLDSNAFLWWMQGGGDLSPDAVRTISAPDTLVAVSVATAWELEIKSQGGRLEIPDTAWRDVALNAFDLLSIDLADAISAARLPLHHRDPFDRMIIAQAMNRDLTVVTRDSAFDKYDVQVLRA